MNGAIPPLLVYLSLWCEQGSWTFTFNLRAQVIVWGKKGRGKGKVRLRTDHESPMDE